MIGYLLEISSVAGKSPICVVWMIFRARNLDLKEIWARACLKIGSPPIPIDHHYILPNKATQ